MTESNCEINDLFVKKWFNQKSKKSQMVNNQAKKIFLYVLEIFKNFGHNGAFKKLPGHRIKRLWDDIYEIRVGQYRVAYFWDHEVCVLLYGFKKKTDEWSNEERDLTKTRKKIYFKNKQSNITISKTKTNFNY
jgi:mRNA-degrading endonuclease RelE of RelBE toxin-antitoxin system